MSRKTIILFIVMLLILIFPNKTFAWVCSNSQEIKGLYRSNDSVFIGKVLGMSYENVGSLNPKTRVTFAMKSVLKGHDTETVTVVATAGSIFTLNTEYLVYAYKTTEDNYLYTYEEGEFATDTWCGGTKELSLAEHDLEQIAEMKAINTILFVIASSLVILTLIIATIRLIKRKHQNNDDIND